MQADKQQHIFKPNSRFSDVINLYTLIENSASCCSILSKR
ncbi:hypothetical protein [Parapedobacter pyrenivorans]